MRSFIAAEDEKRQRRTEPDLYRE